MRYSYSAREAKGGIHKGVIEADQPKTAAAILKERKLLPIAITPVQPWMDIGVSLAKVRKVSAIEVANFTRQLATMITAGLPITDGLNLLKLQSSATFSPIVAAILNDVQGGVSLSQSLGKHPQVFSKVYVALVKAGESAGVLETILNRLADTLEKSRQFRAKVTGALIYPAIVVAGMVGVMVIMMWVVIPKLTVLYADFGAELPFATRVIVFLSNMVTKFGVVLIILLIAAGYGVSRYMATLAGRKRWDTLKYKVPIVGPLLQQVMLTELTRTLALLVGAGVSIVEALNIVAGALGNTVVEGQVKQLANKVEKGFPLSIGFAESAIFPPMLSQMVAVGEETGKLDDVLQKLSTFYESESENKVKALTTAIEPIIIIILGVGVGFLVFAVIMPIYTLTNKF